MATTLILVCQKCGGYLLAKAEQKTRTCPYCDATVTVQNARKVGSADTSYEASRILRRLKNEARLKEQRH